MCNLAIFIFQLSVALSYTTHRSFRASSIISHRHSLSALFSSIDSNPSSSTTTNTPISPTSTVQLKSFFDYVTTSHVSNDFHQIYSRGLELLSKMKPPTTKDEAWRHTNIKTLFVVPPSKLSPNQHTPHISKDEISPYIGPDCAKSHMVFVDGLYIPDLSDTSGLPSAVVAGSYINLHRSGSAAIKSHLDTSVQSSLLYVPDVLEASRNSFGSDMLTAINMIGMVDAAVIQVPAQAHIEVPLQVLFYSSTVDGGIKASYPRLLVDVGADSSIELRQTYISTTVVPSSTATVTKRSITNGEDSSSNSNNSNNNNLKFEFRGESDTVDLLTLEEKNAQGEGDGTSSSSSSSSSLRSVESMGALVAANTRVLVGENAIVRHSYSQELSSLTGRHAEVLSADLGKNTSYTFTAVQMGCVNSRLNVHTNIMGIGSNCSVNGVMLCEEKQSSDMHSSIVHDTPGANSRQQQRIVVASKSQGVFKGRIRIPQHAQETDSDQLCRSVMLGDRARVIAMPTLEITADNVVCSHGASVADLDPNAIFYLKARGISALMARKLLLKGFVLEVLIANKMEAGVLARVLQKVEHMSPDRPQLSGGSGSSGTDGANYVSM